VFSPNVLYYGNPKPLPERVPLRAGPLSLIYEAGDLRYIKLGDQEILRRIYVAIRDQNWGTVPPALSNVRLDIGDDSFRVTYDVENRQGDIDFSWKGMITGDDQGTITFTMDGVARSTFLRNRIGFCVLHPMRECAGQPCIVEKVNDTVEHGRFPKFISPHQPFMDIQAISHQIIPGVWAEVRFSGDIFEMEDQRNWTDASYKTYCTPLDLPFPVQVEEGTEISQSVTLNLRRDTPPKRVAPLPPAELTLTIGQSPLGSLPRIGLGTASHGRPLSAKELARLRALNLSHLHVDLDLSRPGYESKLRQATVEASALDVPLEVALFLSDAAAGEMKALVATIKAAKPAVCTWLVFHIAQDATRTEWINLAREYLAAYDPAPQIGGGTNAYFTNLNRNRPPVAALDIVSYSLNPQVHAFDSSSLAETLETQATTIESARQFVGTLPLAISPITLKPRFNPAATGPESELPPRKLPAQVDVRQMSLFGAGWTTGSLKYVSEGGAYSVTYYETSGWRGVMETEAGSRLPDKFRSRPGSVFPLYHILADVGEFAGGDVIPTTSSDTLRVDGLAVHKDGQTRVLLANLCGEAQQVTVKNLGKQIRVRHLDETNVEEAMTSPERFRTRATEHLETQGGALQLTLLPYATARLDTA
jgi:hypothetical protein